MRSAVLSTTYFGPVQWYQKLYRFETVYLEQWENFQKQTFRNRCVIATTNGLQTLTVPVEHTEGHSILSLRISDHGKWRTEHWNALQSAYGDSPFFDYYADDLRPFFGQHWDSLFDFNLAITRKMCELLDIHPDIRLTESYAKDGDLAEPHVQAVGDKLPAVIDFRTAIRPKHPLPDPDFLPRRYYQVYEQKHGFQPNLSILDLLFNMGNEAILYL